MRMEISIDGTLNLLETSEVLKRLHELSNEYQLEINVNHLDGGS